MDKIEKIRVLLIEDDPGDASLVKKYLNEISRMRFEINHVQTLSEGLASFGEGEPHVVLLDMSLSDCCGIDTFRKIHAFHSDAPIIVMTGTQDEETAINTLKEGAQDYIVKGMINSNALFRIILYSRERQKLANELKRTQSQLIQSEKMGSIGQLAAGVAHEINNPISFISSNINTLNGYVEDLFKLIGKYEERCESFCGDSADVKAVNAQIDHIKKQLNYDYISRDIRDLISETIDGTERVARIVKNLKEFSHVDQNEKKIYSDLNSVVEKSLNIVSHVTKYKAEVIKELTPIPQVRCYPHQLSQVFMNLLVNAVQSIKEKGEIRVRSWADGEDVFISFSDTGKGIPPNVKKRIFEPFFTTKPVGEGTGLGLSVSYGIIEKNNGCISVDSKEGKGTTFTIKLPVDQ